MNEDLERLKATAAEGDRDALGSLFREAQRREDPVLLRWCASLEHAEDAFRRRIARVLLTQGEPLAMCDAQGDAISPAAAFARDQTLRLVGSRMLAPVEVPLLWSASIARLCLCDVAEYVLESELVQGEEARAIAQEMVKEARRIARGERKPEYSGGLELTQVGVHQRIAIAFGELWSSNIGFASWRFLREVRVVWMEFYTRSKSLYQDIALTYLLAERPLMS